MYNNSEIIYTTINKKDTLLLYWNDISKLFRLCFQKELDFDLWKWSAIDNPYDEPLVVLAHKNSELVGYYSFIPQEYIQRSTKKIFKAYLSMNSMVRWDVVKHNVFKQLTIIANTLALENKYDFVLGFPNKNAVNGLKKRIHWNIEPISCVYTLTKNEILSYVNKNKDILDKNNISINVNNKYKNWRFSKPKQKYYDEKSIFKKLKNNYNDIIFLDELSFLKENQKYNILLPNNIDKLSEKVKFRYQFAYKLLNYKESTITFKKDLIMSDVF